MVLNLFKFHLVPPALVEPTAETTDPSKEPVKKKKKGRRREAALQRLLAVGHKIQHVLISG